MVLEKLVESKKICKAVFILAVSAFFVSFAMLWPSASGMRTYIFAPALVFLLPLPFIWLRSKVLQALIVFALIVGAFAVLFSGAIEYVRMYNAG